MSAQFMRGAVALTFLALSGTALAHPGHAEGIAAGLLHPVTGLDHLLAMLAVGIWASRLGGQARWQVPVSFIACMLLAAVLAMAGDSLPMLESGLALSVLLAGLLLVFGVRMKAAAGALTVALFAFFHGYAHGLEMPKLASSWMYAGGLALTTAALLGAGVLAGAILSRKSWILPAAGAAVAAYGSWMWAAIA